MLLGDISSSVLSLRMILTLLSHGSPKDLESRQTAFQAKIVQGLNNLCQPHVVAVGPLL